MKANFSRNLIVASLQKVSFASPLDRERALRVSLILVEYSWRNQTCKMVKNDFFKIFKANILRNLTVRRIQKVLFCSLFVGQHAREISFILVEYSRRNQTCKMAQNNFFEV